jgi:RNA polymerase sigma-70 factor (ECF subfamily)
VRRRVRQRRLSTRLTERATLTSTSTPDTAGSHALEALLDTLEPDRREAFVLTQVAGCSYADAAEICGVPVGTIRSRVARAREDLVAEVRAAETA